MPKDRSSATVIHVLFDLVFGPPPAGTFDIDSDVGPNWEIEHVDTAESDSDSAILTCSIFVRY